MSLRYILVNREPVPADDLAVWGAWFNSPSNRIVAQDRPSPEVLISTVFLGLDHNFSHEGPPLLFETMVFGGEFDEETYRYCSWDEAVEGHGNVVARVQSGDVEAVGGTR